jgi:hypothetical protein
MDGLSSSSDRKMYSEALMLYFYRTRLAQGPQSKLTNMFILEEAHHLLPAKAAGTSESVLETSIRMVRQYGLGFVIVDQSVSLLSRVACANNSATIALEPARFDDDVERRIWPPENAPGIFPDENSAVRREKYGRRETRHLQLHDSCTIRRRPCCRCVARFERRGWDLLAPHRYTRCARRRCVLLVFRSDERRKGAVVTIQPGRAIGHPLTGANSNVSVRLCVDDGRPERGQCGGDGCGLRELAGTAGVHECHPLSLDIALSYVPACKL